MDELMQTESVVLTSGQAFSVDDPDAYPDGALIVSNAGRDSVITPDQILEVRTVNRLRGFFEGLGLGALTGTVAGALVGLSDGDDDPNSFLALRAEEKAMIAGIVFGMGGAIAGALIGLARGSTDVYTYDSPTIGLAPTDGGAQLSVGVRF